MSVSKHLRSLAVTFTGWDEAGGNAPAQLTPEVRPGLEDSLLLEPLPGPWPGTPGAAQADGHPGSSSTPQGLQQIPASSEWASEDSGLSGGSGSVPVARGLPGRASSRVSASCSGVDGSLRVARGPPSGLQALLSASAKKNIPPLAKPVLPSDVLSSCHVPFRAGRGVLHPAPPALESLSAHPPQAASARGGPGLRPAHRRPPVSPHSDPCGRRTMPPP